MLLKKRARENELNQLHMYLARQKENRHISSEFIKFTELLEIDPAPLIKPELDWHFIGSNLAMINFNNIEYLIQPSMTNDYSMRLLEIQDSMPLQVEQTNQKWFRKNYGYEILTTKGSDYIGIRKGDRINFMKREHVNTEEQLQLHAPITFKWQSEIAATSMLGNDLVFIDVLNHLAKINLADFSVQYTKELPLIYGKHQFPIDIRSIDQNVITFNNRKSLNVIDTRCDFIDKIFDASDLLITCEELSCHRKSIFENLLYLGSTHVLYGIDLRRPKGTVIHWNHQIVEFPTIIETTLFREHEIICLSSNITGDMKIFNNAPGTTKETWRINRLPFKPKRVTQTYQKCLDQGLLLFAEPIEYRLEMRTTGVVMSSSSSSIKSSDRLRLFTQNSIGDIFETHLLCNSQDDQKMNRPAHNIDVVDRFVNWAKLLDIPKETCSDKNVIKNAELHLDDIVELKGVIRVLRCEKLQNSSNTIPEHDTEMSCKMIPKWALSIEKAQSYKDTLAPEILAIWDIDIKAIESKPFEKDLLPLRKQDKQDQITRWLEMAVVNEMDFPMDTLDQLPNSPPNTQQTGVTTLKQKKVKTSQRVTGF